MRNEELSHCAVYKNTNKNKYLVFFTGLALSQFA